MTYPFFPACVESRGTKYHLRIILLSVLDVSLNLSLPTSLSKQNFCTHFLHVYHMSTQSQSSSNQTNDIAVQLHRL